MVKRRIELLILGSKETITVDGKLGHEDLGVIDEGGVAVSNGKIIEATSSRLLEKKYDAKRVIDATGEIVLPGFVDPHTHLVFDGSREDEFGLRIAGLPYLETLRRGGGILETVNRTRQATPMALLDAATTRLDIALERGTTTIEIKSGYGLRLQDEIKMLDTINILRMNHPCRVISTFLGAHAIPSEYAESDSYTKCVVDDMIPVVGRRGLATFCDVFCEKGAFDQRSSIKILRAAANHGMKPKIHADEFSDSGGAQAANLSRAVSADHMIHSPTRELEKMQSTGVSPVLLPASSFSLLAQEHARAKEMLSLNLPVALGTDFSPSNWILGQMTVGAIAARQLRMTADEIIRGITINAARALGLEKTVGALTPGRAADIAILRAPSHKWIGYSYGEGLVDKVLIGGEVVVDKGRRVR